MHHAHAAYPPVAAASNGAAWDSEAFEAGLQAWIDEPLVSNDQRESRRTAAGMIRLWQRENGHLPTQLAQSLDLSGRHLTSLPAAIGLLTNLQELDLSRNQLVALPREIGRLQSMRNLRLTSNRIESLPDELCQLHSLVRLALYNNELTELPADLGNLSNLESLEVSSNRLAHLPDSMARLVGLRSLWINNNPLVDLPVEIGLLPELNDLWMVNNQLTDLPASILQLALRSRVHVNEQVLPQATRDALREAEAARLARIAGPNNGRAVAVVPAGPRRTDRGGGALAWVLQEGEIPELSAEDLLTIQSELARNELALRVFDDLPRAPQILMRDPMLASARQPRGFRAPLSDRAAQPRPQASMRALQVSRLTERDREELSRDNTGRPIAHAASFFTWLERLHRELDPAHPNTRELLGKLDELIGELRTDVTLRERCFEIAADALTACSDRVSLALNTMAEAALVARTLRPDVDERTLISAHVDSFVVDLVNAQARARIAELDATASARGGRIGWQEDVETILGFQTAMQGRLAAFGIRVPLPVRSMRYGNWSGVSVEQLDAAATRIADEYRRSVVASLATWPPLIAYVERQFADELAAVDVPYHMALEILQELTEVEGEDAVTEGDYFELAKELMADQAATKLARRDELVMQAVARHIGSNGARLS